MKIFVSVKPKARQDKIEKIDENHYKVSVTEPPVEGRANKAVMNALSEFLGTSKINITLIGGATSREKVFEINDIWISKKKFFKSSKEFRRVGS